jgi:hypothetical protein
VRRFHDEYNSMKTGSGGALAVGRMKDIPPAEAPPFVLSGTMKISVPDADWPCLGPIEPLEE